MSSRKILEIGRLAALMRPAYACPSSPVTPSRITASFEREITPNEAMALNARRGGVVLHDLPTPRLAAGKDATYVGRIPARRDREERSLDVPQQRQPAQGCGAERHTDRRSAAGTSLVCAVASHLATSQVDAVVTESFVENEPAAPARPATGNAIEPDVNSAVSDTCRSSSSSSISSISPSDSNLPSMMMSVAFAPNHRGNLTHAFNESAAARGHLIAQPSRRAREQYVSARSPLRSMSAGFE